MRSVLRSIRRFLSELRRRNVYRVAVTYVVVGFFVIEGADLTLTRLGLPPWTVTLVVVLVGLGFPIALVLAWALEVTPEGVRVEETQASEEEVPAPSSGPRDLWVGASVLVLLLLGAWWLFPFFYDGTPEEAVEESARKTEAPADTAQLASRNRPFVAVLPLENLSPKEENQFFADGIHEEILGQLSKVSGLGVFARTTMLEIADADMTAAEIGRELGARAVLEGSVRRAGDRVRISTQLIDPNSRDHLWSATYERKLSTNAVFDIQAQIAEKVTAALETELTASKRKSIREAPTPDLAAYDAYVKGREYIWEYQSGGANVFKLDSAVAVLRQAVEKDSTFAAAYGLLGFAYGLRFDFTGTSRWLDSARVSIARADSLQPGLVQTHLASGVVRAATGDYAGAEKDLRAVLSQQPGHGFALMEMSEIHLDRGEHAQGLRWALRATQQDPRNAAYIVDVMRILTRLQYYQAAEAWYRHGVRHHPENSLLHLELARIQADQGRYEESYQTATQALEWHPKVIRLHGAAGVALLQLGQLEKARGPLERARKLGDRRHRKSPGFPQLSNPFLGYTYLRLGETERGRRLLAEAAEYERAEVKADSSATDWANLAAIKSALGDSVAAREALRRAVHAGYAGTLHYPLFDPVREASWFQGFRQEAKANRELQRKNVRQMNIDLYPPGAKPDTGSSQSSTDE